MDGHLHLDRSRQQSSCYTYHLPYGTRKKICNLLDADQSWRTLGGQFIGLDATQLTLLGQAIMRNSSPTEELLNKMDSANVRISEFCFYLKQMNHCRAVEILKPYIVIDGGANICCSTTDITMSSKSTLDTPTPSFIEGQPAAIMGCNELNPFDLEPILQHQQQHQQWILPDQFVAKHEQSHNRDPPSNCHKSSANNQCVTGLTGGQPAIQQANQEQYQKVANYDPGDEIVRMACANNRKRTSISDQEVVNQLRLIMQITYNELKQASNNFSDSNILGNGGFASVYRGHWKGTDVAIKRLKCNLMDQALNELTILNSYRIDNILPIYGISIDGPEACLVYQFMSNGSLEDRLSCKKSTPPLNWNQRALIGEGVAKGLYYLHTLRDKPLVHGDVKSANVLLDSQFVPKLGDFGLARQVFKGKNPQTELCTHCTVSSIHGTSVYLPPEYLRHKILSPAVDVYSYGIVLLEMATGRRAYDGKRLLIDLVEDETRSMSMGEISYSLKDSRLADDTQSDLKIWYELLIKLGLNCAHKIKKKRLDMGQVLNRFADFRNSSELSLLDNNNPLNTHLSNGSHTTARTLTPDLTTMDRQQQQQPPLANLSKTTEQQFRPPTMMRNSNSALMSVEEEDEWQLNGIAETNKANPDATQIVNQPVEASIEAMIPLLTELGVVGGGDGQN